jgi:hypothetical protein
MKSLTFILLSAISLFTFASAFKGCDNEQMNKICQSTLVDACYTCTRVNNNIIPPVCVPLFHTNLDVLDNYPRDKWNCTLYRSQDEVFDQEIADKVSDISKDSSNFEYELDSEEELVKDVCKVDDFIYELCGEEDNNGFCMIASYIHDICESKEDNMEIKNYEVSEYVSPWGSKSECITSDYKKICSDKITKSCFDCRTPTLLSYYHLCFPLFASENENALVTRLKKDKWECKKFSNPKYKPSSFHTSTTENLFGGKLYSACTGSICKKEGWSYRGSHFGKEWCGNLPCKEYFGNRVLCNFPTNCNSKKSLSVISDTFQNEFHTLGCGFEKLKCMLKKSCRNMVKQLENCKGDQMCLYTVISKNTNENFRDLVSCMYP